MARTRRVKPNMRENNFMPITSLNAEHFFCEKGVLWAEASTVNFRDCERIYKDAADVRICIYNPKTKNVGICIYNPKTKNQCRFYITKIDKDQDGNIRFWKFLPIPEDAKRFPKAAGVIIWND